MRISKIHFEDVEPIHLFSVENLSDIVVLAGPNGVGKTRLLEKLIQHLQANDSTKNSVTVEATCDDERNAWQKTNLATNDRSDRIVLTKTLQGSPRRGHLRSSILNFDSDRAIQQVKALAWTWDLADPLEEAIGWNVGFGRMRDRYQDVVHSMFKLIQHQKQSIATNAIKLRNAGKDSMSLNFKDPMAPFKDAFFQLLGPKRLADPKPSEGKLSFLDSGITRPFEALSSGEREVVKIAFDFLLRKPRDCVVIFDEPELHLHPELSYRLVKTLQSIGSRNQFFLCTHSAEIVTASLDNTVVFVAPREGREVKNQAVVVGQNDEENNALRMLGHSVGIVSLSRKIVLIEGSDSSLDKQAYGAILQNRFPNLALVPSGGKHTIRSFGHICDQVLNKALWGVDFYMLCDGDLSKTVESISLGQTNDKLKLLPRYHVENFFLDSDVLAASFDQLEPAESKLRDPRVVGEELRRIAQEVLPYAVSLKVSAQIRATVGNVDVMPSGCDKLDRARLVEGITSKADSELNRASAELSAQTVSDLVESTWHECESQLNSADESWKRTFPAKPVFAKYANHCKLTSGRLKNLYITAGLVSDKSPFQEIVDIFEGFSK